MKSRRKMLYAPTMTYDINALVLCKPLIRVITATWESNASQVATVSAVARLSPAYVLLGKLGAGITVLLWKKLCPTLVLHRRRSWDPWVGMLIWDNLRRVSYRILRTLPDATLIQRLCWMASSYNTTFAGRRLVFCRCVHYFLINNANSTFTTIRNSLAYRVTFGWTTGV